MENMASYYEFLQSLQVKPVETVETALTVLTEDPEKNHLLTYSLSDNLKANIYPGDFF